MSRIAIMQPTYLPWIGYFDLMDDVDAFVFLDNVQFDKRSWQQRNRIRTGKGLEWLTIPVKVKGRYHQKINEVHIDNQPSFPDKHIRAVHMHYRGARYFDDYFAEFEEQLRRGAESTLLCELNIGLIKWAMRRLGIRTGCHRSSALGAAGKRSALLIDICQRLGADRYLSPMGALGYLTQERRLFDDSDISVFLRRYEHPVYPQMYEPFMPYACVLDMLFNLGDRALEVISSGRGQPMRLEEVTQCHT